MGRSPRRSLAPLKYCTSTVTRTYTPYPIWSRSAFVIRLLKTLYGVKTLYGLSAVRVGGGYRLVSKSGWRVVGMCVSPLLFCNFLEVVTALALDEEDLGVLVSGVHVNNLKFADDIGLMAESEEDLQLLVTRTDTESHRFGLTISTAKAEV